MLGWRCLGCGNADEVHGSRVPGSGFELRFTTQSRLLLPNLRLTPSKGEPENPEPGTGNRQPLGFYVVGRALVRVRAGVQRRSLKSLILLPETRTPSARRSDRFSSRLPP
jgi:hypothetical protein